MGEITQRAETEKTTFNERKDVKAKVDKIAEEMGWDLSDVRNRAMMYYAYQYENDSLNDPLVDKVKSDKLD